MAKEEVFVVDDVTCATCALTVENTVKRLDHVDSTVINLTTRKMTVDYNSDLVSEKEIEKAVADADYSASVFDSTTAKSQSKC